MPNTLTRWIANVGVAITQAERDDMVQDLVNGKSRADVLAKLVDNPTVSRGEFNSAFVLMAILRLPGS